MNELKVLDFGVDWTSLHEEFQMVGLDFGISLIAAIAIFFIGRIVVRFVTNGTRKVMESQKVDKILESFVNNLVYWTLMTVVIIAAINQIDIQTTSLIAIMGAAGLAVGLAMQGSLANFSAGVLIIMFRPYRVGDYIEAAGVAGSVVQVQIFTTILKTVDNKQIIIPNGQIMGSVITNYSSNETRRVDLVIGIGYDDDIDEARDTIQALVDADDRILKDPACPIAVAELADSSVNIAVRPWVKTADYSAVRFGLTEAVKKRFDKEGISFPFPQQDVHLIQNS